jgi:hypothetical protein
MYYKSLLKDGGRGRGMVIGQIKRGNMPEIFSLREKTCACPRSSPQPYIIMYYCSLTFLLTFKLDVIKLHLIFMQ